MADLVDRNPPVRVAHVLQECQGWDIFHSAENMQIADYFVATYTLFDLQLTLTVQVSQPKSDHCPLHLSLHLPHTSTPASLPPPQRLQKFRHSSVRVSQYCAHLATQLSNIRVEEHPATWLKTCIATSSAATHGLQLPTRATHALLMHPSLGLMQNVGKQDVHYAWIPIHQHVHHHHSSLLASYKALLCRKRGPG